MTQNSEKEWDLVVHMGPDNRMKAITIGHFCNPDQDFRNSSKVIKADYCTVCGKEVPQSIRNKYKDVLSVVVWSR